MPDPELRAIILVKNRWRLLALHGNPKFGRWPSSALKLLGALTDAQLARRFHRTESAVATRRRKRGIPKPDPVRSVGHRRAALGLPKPDSRFRTWTPEDEALLGTDLDKNIARKLNCDLSVVQLRRTRLGIRPFGRHFWSPPEISQLGTAPDEVIAQRLGRTVASVRVQRLRLKIRAAPRPHP